MFRQFSSGTTEAFRIWTIGTLGTLISEYANAGISFLTNVTGGGGTRLFIGTLGGVSIGATGVDPGLNNLNITPSTYIGGASSTVPACNSGSPALLQ